MRNSSTDCHFLTRKQGMDMTAAFVEHLSGKEVSEFIRARIELSCRDQDNDEFAAVHGLV